MIPAAGESATVHFDEGVLTAGQEAVTRTARSLLPIAQSVSDEPTADLLTQRIQSHEKNAWLLRSLLEE